MSLFPHPLHLMGKCGSSHSCAYPIHNGKKGEWCPTPLHLPWPASTLCKLQSIGGCHLGPWATALSTSPTLLYISKTHNCCPFHITMREAGGSRGWGAGWSCNGACYGNDRRCGCWGGGGSNMMLNQESLLLARAPLLTIYFNPWKNPHGCYNNTKVPTWRNSLL